MPTSNSKQTKVVKPEVLGGFRDLLPGDALIFQRVIERIRRVYESFGFVPLDTPCMERLAVLTGGKEFNKSIFTARIVRGLEDRGATDLVSEQDYALRFDLTVPLARVVAANPDLPRPFKRYQIGKVWRGERPQAGRFREFYQFDFDIINSNSILSDIEVIQIMYETMKALGIKNFLIAFNTRKILNGLTEIAGCLDKATEVFRIIDKMDKIGIDGVCRELQRQPDSESDENALALNDEQTSRIKTFLELKSDDPNELIVQLETFFGNQSTLGSEGIQELKSIVIALKQLGIPQQNWNVDLSIARGLDYYTGPVFEIKLTDMPELGSVFSGGRFDGLTNRFMPGSNIAGVGASVGVDRLIVGIQQLGLIEKQFSVTDVLVTVFNADLQDYSMRLAQEIRKRGLRTELFLGNDYTLRAQFAYAAKQSIPFVVVVGPDEAAVGKVNLKNMQTRVQETLTPEECFAKLEQSLQQG